MGSLTNFFYKREIKQFLNTAPVPILYPEKRLILLWNAKAGCTFSIKWMFAQMKLLEKATKYHHWIHIYRTEVYYKSRQYQKGIKSFIKEPDSFTAIKIVSDPFKRAYRSYIHACTHGYEDDKLSHFLQREINNGKRFSFREFVHYLKSVNINKCNIHHKMQTSDLERKNIIKIIKIINLEYSLREIPLFENANNLNNIDLQEMRKSPHNHPKYRAYKFMGDVVMNEIYQECKLKVPEYQQFYDEEIEEIISEVYREDFERYNFELKIRR